MKKILLMALLVCGVATNAADLNVETNPKFTIGAGTSDVSALCKFIANNDVEGVKKLLNLGENVNAYSGGMTPLMYAARYNRTEIIKLLIAKGAKIKAKDSRGNTALVHAQRSGAKKAEALLVKLVEEQKAMKKAKRKKRR